MPTIAIIGAGVSGCVLARALAEDGYRVHVYERQDRVGGMAYQGQMNFTCADMTVKQFLQGRMSYKQADETQYAPLISWRVSCEEILFHRHINWMTSSELWSGIASLQLLGKHYDDVFISAPLDSLCGYNQGHLQYVSGIPLGGSSDKEMYQTYRNLLLRLHFIPFGYHGLYMPLSIEHCMRQAIELAYEYRSGQRDMMQVRVAETTQHQRDVLISETEMVNKVRDAAKLQGVRALFQEPGQELRKE